MKSIFSKEQPFFIAEVGQNHNGDFEEAKIVLTRMRAEAESETPTKSSVIDENEF